MAAVTLASGFRVGASLGARPFTTDPVDTGAGGTMRLDVSGTFDALTGAAVAVVDVAVETSANSNGPWRTLGEVRLTKDSTSTRATITGVDSYSRLRGVFGGNGGVALTVSGTLL